MSFCPNCRTIIASDAKECGTCGALFTGEGWAPVDIQPPVPPAPRSAASIIVMIGVASVLIPASGFIVAIILTAVVPGCSCNEGTGCHGCGANRLMEFVYFGGLVGALVAVVTTLPGSLVLAAVVRFLSRYDR